MILDKCKMRTKHMFLLDVIEEAIESDFLASGCNKAGRLEERFTGKKRQKDLFQFVPPEEYLASSGRAMGGPRKPDFLSTESRGCCNVTIAKKMSALRLLMIGTNRFSPPRFIEKRL